jgi:hypothetical protein
MKLTATVAATALCLSTSWTLAAAPAKPARKAPPVVTLAEASPEQLAAAERTHFGVYACEFNQTIDVGMNPKTPGYVDVKFLKDTYTMKPVQSSTGALRLEDVKGKTLLLHSCVHESQREAALAAAASK